MAMLMISDASDNTLAQYDEVGKRLAAAGQMHPPGRLSHVAARKGTGYLIVDVWESQEAFDRFAQTLRPLFAQVGGTVAPMQAYPVHNRIDRA